MNVFTELIEGLRIAWEAIRANKMRSVLTTLGIVIGIVTVTLMGAALDGLNQSFHQSIAIFGSDVFHVSRFSRLATSEAEWLKALKRRYVTLAQARGVEKQMTGAQAVAPVTFMSRPVSYKNRSASNVQIIGSNERFLSTCAMTIGEGRFFSTDEAQGGRPVCVIGAQVATNLFRSEPCLGKRVKVGERMLEVVGVLSKQGAFLGIKSMDNQVIIPVHVFLTYIHEPDFQIWVKASGTEQMEEAREELHGLMRKVRRLAPGDADDFAIVQQEQLVKQFNMIAGIIGGVGLLITGMSLFVGGIGIMNIMFVSVTERTREIGIRKAIGAKRRTILLQFLLEAAGICLIGGLIGVLMTWVATLVISPYMSLSMSVPVMMMAIGVSLLTGVASGFFPAWRAARMDPVEALRSE